MDRQHFRFWVTSYRCGTKTVSNRQPRVVFAKSKSICLNFKFLDNVAYLDELAQKYVSPVRVWMGPNLYIFLHDAKSIDTLLRSKISLDKAPVYRAVREALGGDGLFTSKSDQWRTHRRLLNPSMKDSTISSHLTIFNYYLREFCTIQLANEANNGVPFDLMPLANVVLLSMFLEATFGQEWTRKTEYTQIFNL